MYISIYILIIFIAFLFGKYNFYISFFLFSLAVLIFSLNFNIESPTDSISYIEIFDKISIYDNINNVFVYQGSYLFTILVLLVKLFGLNYEIFVRLIPLIIWIFYYRFNFISAKKCSFIGIPYLEYLLVSCSFFLLSEPFVFLSINVLRQGMALPILFFIIIKWTYNNNIKILYFIIFLLLSILIHQSLVFYLLPLFILNLLPYKVYQKKILLLIINLIITISGYFAIKISGLAKFTTYIDREYNSTFYIIKLVLLTIITLVGFLFSTKSNNILSKIFTLLLFGLSSIFITIDAPIFSSRLLYYEQVVFLFFIPVIFNFFFRNIALKNKLVFISFLILSILTFIIFNTSSMKEELGL